MEMKRSTDINSRKDSIFRTGHPGNRSLADQVYHELLKNPAQIMSHRNGSVKFFVKGNVLKKRFRKRILGQSDIDIDLDEGITFGTLKKLAELVSSAISREETPIEYGILIIDYCANKEGEKIQNFEINFEDEIHHSRLTTRN